VRYKLAIARDNSEKKVRIVRYTLVNLINKVRIVRNKVSILKEILKF